MVKGVFEGAEGLRGARAITTIDTTTVCAPTPRLYRIMPKHSHGTKTNFPQYKHFLRYHQPLKLRKE
ncbi:hypothetical protein LR007_00120 [candidate division NPL-UPA2 bacterium]|nr:hypothetical protein [candidate division NPL-UPA2 bacterium]